jgi:hypothetical protein
MLTVMPPFFDHSRHKLVVHRLPFSLDVLAFEGEEQLSQPFHYRVEFTSVEQDIGAKRVLGKTAQFILHAAAHTLPVAIRGLPVPRVKALRTLHGVVTGFKRLSGSADEARDEVTLEPRLAPEEIVFSCGGAFIRIKDGEIELGAPGNIHHRAAYVLKGGATTLTTPATPIPPGYAAGYTLSDPVKGYASFVRYLITTQEGERFPGVTDKDGKTIPVHTLLPGNVVIEFPNDKHDEQ